LGQLVDLLSPLSSSIFFPIAVSPFSITIATSVWSANWTL